MRAALAGLSLVCLSFAAEACRCDLNGASFEHLAKNGTLVVQGIAKVDGDRVTGRIRDARKEESISVQQLLKLLGKR